MWNIQVKKKKKGKGNYLTSVAKQAKTAFLHGPTVWKSPWYTKDVENCIGSRQDKVKVLLKISESHESAAHRGLKWMTKAAHSEGCASRAPIFFQGTNLAKTRVPHSPGQTTRFRFFANKDSFGSTWTECGISFCQNLRGLWHKHSEY